MRLALLASMVLTLFAFRADAQLCADGELLMHEGDKGTLVCKKLKLVPSTAATGVVPFVDADGRAAHDDTFWYDSVSQVLSVPVVTANELGVPSGTSCTSTTAGRICLDTNGITEYTDPVLTLRTGGANKPIPIFSSLGTAGVAALFGKNASNAGVVYPIATTPTNDAVPLANGSNKINGGWLPGVANGGTVAARSAATPTTNAIGVWDGTAFGDGSATCVDAGGVLTCDDYAVRNVNAVASQRAVLQAHGCTASTTKNAAAMGGTACSNMEGGGISAVRSAGIPLNQLRAVNLKAITLNLWGFGTGAGWEADEAFEFTVSRCTLDATAALADCTDVDTFVIQNRATPNITYGAGSRTARSCTTAGGTCSQTWNIDGGGRVSSAGDPTLDAGVAQYLVVWFESDATNYTADAATDAGAIHAAFTLDFKN